MSIAEENRVTIDHETIRRWAEERGGYPATVQGSHSGGDDVGVLKIGFGNEEELEPIDWDEFFSKFEEKALEMRYRDEPAESGSQRYYEFFRRR